MGASRPATSDVVKVFYVNPERFTDFTVQNRDVQNSQNVFTGEVMGALTPVMLSRFPGSRLTLRFRDIDLAGRRAPVRGRSVRIIRRSSPARLLFDYLLQDSSGRALASGSQKLVDTAPQTLADNPARSQAGRRESRMLERWLSSLSINR